MATKIVMEALSPTMEEGRLIEWKKKEGDPVAVGDVLAEVETDKAVMELVARAAGTLLKQLVAAGATVPVSAPVGWIGTAGESVNGGGAPAAPEAASGASRPRSDSDVSSRGGTPASATSEGSSRGATPAATTSEGSSRGGSAAVATSEGSSRGGAAAVATPPAAAAEPAAQAAPPATQPAPSSPSAPSARVKASPLARKIAADTGVDLGTVSGSGPEGRVIKRDLDQARSERSEVRAAVPLGSQLSPLTAFEDVPLTQIRKTIAKRLVQSIGPIPTFYLTSDVDMERVAEAREALNAAGGETGKISFNDIILKAVATALRQHPACNAWWQDDHIRVWNEVHLGVAVATDEGLIVPVLRNAERKNLRQISAETRDLAGRARERKLKPEEYTGSTFSVSNLGMFDIEHFTAIINPPEAGIIAVGRITPVAAVVSGAVEIRRRMRLTMSCDHRVIDGAAGAQFMKTLKLLLENPLALVW